MTIHIATLAILGGALLFAAVWWADFKTSEKLFYTGLLLFDAAMLVALARWWGSG